MAYETRFDKKQAWEWSDALTQELYPEIPPRAARDAQNIMRREGQLAEACREGWPPVEWRARNREGEALLMDQLVNPA